MEQAIQEKVKATAQLLVEGEYAASMQIIRLTIAEMNDEKITELMGRKLDVISKKCNAIIDAVKAALESEEIDGHVIAQNLRWQSAINVQWMSEQYYSFFIKVLSEQGYYKLT